MNECRRRVPPGTEKESVLPQLLKIREDAVGKIFKGCITLPEYSAQETQASFNDEEFFLNCVTDTFVKKYTELIALATVQHILNRAQFLDLGVTILDKTPGKCPFCGQQVNDMLSQHIHDEHKNVNHCPLCGDNIEITNVEMSYAFKLMLDELRSLCVYPKLKLENKY